MRTLAALGLALVAGCGDSAATPASAPAGPGAGSALVGRWACADGTRVVELLADGTLVDLIEFESERSTREPDGSYRKDIVPAFQCYLGSYRGDGAAFAFDLTRVGDLTTREGTGSLAGGALTLVEEGESEAFARADRPVPPEATPLVGLWRRVGNTTTDHVDLGIRFTPGGLGIVVGKNSIWDSRSSTGSIGWLCMFERYEVREGALREVRPSEPDRPRTRAFTIEGDRLVFGPALVYERVHGVVPLVRGRLDLAAWTSLR
jgi:hypothetical protein